MGQLKQLLLLGSLTAIEHCANTVLSSGVSDVVLVISSDGAAVSTAVEPLPIRVAVNPDNCSDMAASVRVGLNALENSASAVMICLADHPLVLQETIKAMLDAHQKNPEAVIIPSHNGRRGHPTLFPRKIIQEIFASSSLRVLISRHESLIQYVVVEDRGVVLDMDRPEDYAMILQEYTSRKENP